MEFEVGLQLHSQQLVVESVVLVVDKFHIDMAVDIEERVHMQTI